jgi:anti-sigma regulatory factor (Ser/Thr protein kinase)
VPSATFVPLVSQVDAARSFAASLALELGCDPDDTALVVSELATNACIHAESAYTVSMNRSAGGVVVEVADHHPKPPRQRHPAPTAVSGRGLVIVEALSRNWGVRNDPQFGKVVWAELEGRAG